MHEGILDQLFEEHLQMECSICLTNYNLEDKRPYVLCLNHHLCCSQCLTKLFRIRNKIDCPRCRVSIQKAGAFSFRPFKEYLILQDKVKRLFDEQVLKAHRIPLKIANELFFKKQFNHTIEICSEIIKTNIIPSQNFQAYGHNEQYNSYGKKQSDHIFSTLKKNGKLINIFDLIILSHKMMNTEEQLLSFMLDISQKFPLNEYIAYLIGILSSNLSLHQQAINYYFLSCQLNFRLPKIYCWLAFSYQKIGNLLQAKQFTLKSINQDNEKMYSQFLQIKIQLRMNNKHNFDFWEQKLKKLIQKYPNYLSPQQQLALYRKKNINFDKQIQYYTNCIQKGYDIDQANKEAPLCYRKQNIPSQILQILGYQCSKKNQKVNQREYQQWASMVGCSCLRLKKYEWAIKIFAKIMHLRYQDAKIYGYQAQAHLGCKHLRQAVECLEKGFKINPKQYSLLNIFDKFCLEGQNIKMEPITYTKIINAYCEIENYELALKYLSKFPYNNSLTQSYRKIRQINTIIHEKKPKKIQKQRRKISYIPFIL